MRLALVHERFTDFTGSEAVLDQFRQIWPDARVHAPIVDTSVLPPGFEVQATRLNSLYRGGSSYSYLLPLLPVAMRHMRIERVDAVLVSHHAFANQVVWATEAPVVSYVHTPARWMWQSDMRLGEPGGALGGYALTAFSSLERPRDRRAAQRVRLLLANSSAVAERIRAWWGRESHVVHPPVDVDYYRPSPGTAREEFFLVAGRLVPYKRPELAVAAAKRAGVPLVVTGDGRALHACENLAGTDVRFLGRVTRSEQRELFRRCRALVMPGEEDFGIVPVEAQACGAPVIAYGRGGALDTVVPGVTGLLTGGESDDERIGQLATAMADPPSFDPAVIHEHAQKFSPERFRREIKQKVMSALD